MRFMCCSVISLLPCAPCTALYCLYVIGLYRIFCNALFFVLRCVFCAAVYVLSALQCIPCTSVFDCIVFFVFLYHKAFSVQ